MSTDPIDSGDGVSRRDVLRRMGGIGLVGLLTGLPVLEGRRSPRQRSDRPGQRKTADTPYVFNRAPLTPNPYTPLPVGDVEPRGWLRDQLQTAADGLTGRLPEIYPNVGETNAWRGGNGDVWERGPYWLDGAVPLAYILDHDGLKEAMRPYLEWTLQSQRSDGYFGPLPDKDYLDREGFQTERPGDWWPRMVMLKVLQNYHSATGDDRVPELMTNYFRYQQETLPEKPLDHWSWWSQRRGGENQASVYWLYNRTGDDFLLDLAQTLYDQTTPWAKRFSEEQDVWHVVNTAMGIKQPALHYLQTGDDRYLDAIDEGLRYLMQEHGQPQGMFSGDELLHGTDPVHGTEFCAVVETMFSLETLLSITGRVDLADRLERIAYNALPTQHSDDYMRRQYYQQPNQIEVTAVPLGATPFTTNHDGMDNCFGLLNGYPCCTTNLHQGWPKYVRRLWHATPDGGLVALIYGPCAATARVAGGVEVTVEEQTRYPFEDTVRLDLSMESPASFPLHLRIPSWTEEATIRVNETTVAQPPGGRITPVERNWSDGDIVTIELPATVEARTGHERAASLARGPLVFALPISARREEIDRHHGVPTYAFHPDEPWNYGLRIDRVEPSGDVEVEHRDTDGFPWTTDEAPIRLHVDGHRVEGWNTYNGGAGPLPPSPVSAEGTPESLELVPYGSTTLRVTEFPVVRT